MRRITSVATTLLLSACVATAAESRGVDNGRGQERSAQAAVVDDSAMRAALLSPLVFDWQAYLALNPELMKSGVIDRASAESHWTAQGAGEGRQACGSYSVRQYLQSNPALRGELGTDFRKAIQHYVHHGHSQGLTGYPVTPGFGAVLPESLGQTGNAVVGTRALKITTASRFGGAVDGVYFGGTNFVNNHDHGRQIQIASWDNGMGEANNPNEAGWHRDKESTSSVLLSIKADSASITTVVQPAYYLRNGETSPFSPKEITLPPPPGETVSRDPYFSKKIEVNVDGDPQLFSIASSMHIDKSLKSTIFQPSFVALNGEFSAFYELGADFNYKAITYDKHPKVGIRPVILSTANGRYALGVYSPSLDGTQTVYSGSYYTWGDPRKPDNDTANLSVAYSYPSTVQGTLSQIVYFVVGNLADVRVKLLAVVNSKRANSAPRGVEKQ